nr:copia protein [Tanacetum cinerariifolium]
MDADDQTIQTILLCLPEDVYAAVDSCETAKEIWERVQQMMKGSDIGEQEKKAKLFNECASNTLDPLNRKLESKIVELEFEVVNYEREISHLKTTYTNLFDSITSNRAHAKLHDLIYENAQLRARVFENTSESMKNTSGTSVTPHVDKPKLSVVTPHSKKLHASMPLHSNSGIQGAQNAVQNAGVQNGGNQNGLVVVPGIANQSGTGNVVAARAEGYNAWQNSGIQGAQNDVQNAGVQNGRNQNGLVVVPGIANQSGTSNVVAARAEGTRNGNQARRFDDDILVVQVYVDDIIFDSIDPRYATLFSDIMKSRFELSMTGKMTFFLGLQVNQSPNGIFINQSKYAHEILKKYGLNTCDIAVTMEILLEPTSNKLLVGDIGDSIWIELVTLDFNLGPE